MASTLELVYDRNQVIQLWSWTASPGGDSQHYTIRLQQRLRNNVYTAGMGLLGEQPTSTVIVKIARADQVSALDWEAELYENDLRGLQGSVVPKCYGYFKGRSDGQALGCLVLEFCNQPFRSADFR
ncbi:hypothetical protein CPB85DRAFT_4916 [Mucidula mucida]|nr:hypothetical protein CPB85DRAFT_4916 [Mucidula mucida]